jgi:hypothetical protein
MCAANAVTSANDNLTGPARRRRESFLRQVAKREAGGSGPERARKHALLDWWLAEVKALPPARQAAEVARLERIVTALNEGRIPDGGGHGV